MWGQPDHGSSLITPASHSSRSDRPGPGALALIASLSPTAGSDYPFGGAPIGRERFYTRVEGPLTYRKWLDGIEQGRTFVSNDPLLNFTVNGRGLGEELVLTQPGPVRIKGSVRFNPDRDQVEKMEVVANGQIIRSFRVSDGASEIRSDFELQVEDAGWVALRASGTKLGLRQSFSSLAHTAPVYLAVQGRPSRAEHSRAKSLCLAWAGRLGELESRLNSQFGAMALFRWDENIAGGYVLKQRLFDRLEASGALEIPIRRPTGDRLDDRKLPR